MAMEWLILGIEGSGVTVIKIVGLGERLLIERNKWGGRIVCVVDSLGCLWEVIVGYGGDGGFWVSYKGERLG